MRFLGQFEQHKIQMDESISFYSVTENFSLSWKVFKHTLKHQLYSHLRIDELLQDKEIVKGNEKEVPGSFVNMVGDDKH